MKYSDYSLNEEHRRILNLMGTKPNVLSEQKTKEVKDEEFHLLNEQDSKDRIKELKDAIKREKQNKKDAKKLDRKGKREARQKARQQKKELKKFEQLCSKFPDAPECSDKDEFVKETEQEIKQVEVDTQDVEDTANDTTKPNDNVDTKETSKLCNLKGDTKWEYKVENEEWYTRKKGSTKWIKLAGDKFIKARRKLDKGCPGFRKTREEEEQKQEKATLQEGCTERAIKEFHKNMMTEVNGTGAAGGTADGFAGVVKDLTQYHKYYCKCMNRNNYEALDLEVSSKVIEFQEKWKTAIGCGNDTKPEDDVATEVEVDEPVTTQPEIQIPDIQPAVQDNTYVAPSYLNTPNFDINLEY